ADNVRGLARSRERAAQENVKRNFEAANALSDLPGPFQALRRKRPTGIMGAGRVVLFRSDAVAHEIEIHGKALKPWAGCCANGPGTRQRRAYRSHHGGGEWSSATNPPRCRRLARRRSASARSAPGR